MPACIVLVADLRERLFVTKEPAKAECAAVLEHAREMGLLIGKGGLWGQTIRFAPPMCITQADADFIIEVFDAAFARL